MTLIINVLMYNNSNPPPLQTRAAKIGKYYQQNHKMISRRLSGQNFSANHAAKPTFHRNPCRHAKPAPQIHAGKAWKVLSAKLYMFIQL